MPASREFASKPETLRPILIVAPNWLGDAIMAMPALQALRAATPDLEFDVLAKPALSELWRLAESRPRNVLLLEPGLSGVLRAAKAIRGHSYAEAYILPKSFRSALPPFLSGIPRRFGLHGHSRDWMLSRAARPIAAPNREHQAFECADLLGLQNTHLPPPRLNIPNSSRRSVANLLGADVSAPIVLAPGARRGPSKRWPAANFAELGRLLREALHKPLLVVGSHAEIDLCRSVADMAGNAISLAGRTSLAELAAVFEAAGVVIANDSGAMHLAAAAGAAVVAIFGMTDPARTGPLGARAVVLQDSELRSRDIARSSTQAAECLARITPRRAFDVALELALRNNASNMQHAGNS